MRAYVDMRRFEGLKLELRARAPGRFAVCMGDLEAGGIALTLAERQERWCWSLTGPHLPVFLQPGTGEALTLFEAQRAMTAKFEAWRNWAHGSPALWNS